MNQYLDLQIQTQFARRQNLPYALVNENLIVTTSSEAMRRWIADPADNLVGRPLPELFPELVGLEDRVRRLFDHPAETLIIPQIYRVSSDDFGCYFDLHVEAFLEIDQTLLIVVIEVTEEAHLEQRLRQERNELRLNILARQQAEAALQKAYEELEERVKERTLALSQANTTLQQQIIERERAEAALRQAHAELERRVMERTAELAQLNTSLKEEIAERQRVEEALRHNQTRYALAINAGKVGVWDLHIETRVIYLQSSLKAILGYEDDEIQNLGADWTRLVHPDDLDKLIATAQAHLDGLIPHLELEHRLLHKDGTERWVYTRGTAIINREIGKATRMMGTVTDITERKLFEKQLFEAAFHDSLTGLPNRALFMQRLDQAVKQAQDHKSYSFALFFLDLDRFKVINDSLGHTYGDQLLITIAHRLEACLNPGDTVARLGGDEFTLLLNNLPDTWLAKQIADQILLEVTKPVDLGEHKVFPTASIGITLSNRLYTHAEDLLRDADTAMYEAKTEGRARCKLFDTGQHTRAVSRMRMEGDLWQAVKRQEFRVYYQPIISLRSGQILGVEALLRWQHAQRGLIEPSEFIALTEETGLIVPLGKWVLQQACIQVKAWHAMGYPALRLAVNISQRQLVERQHLLESINQVLAETGFPAQMLELELVEPIVSSPHNHGLVILDELHARGVHLSLDDFGTSSSLNLLKRLPLATLKIDQSFIKKMTPDDEAIILAIITLAHSLKLKIVAEGVTTAYQVHFLKGQQCDEAQGYLFSPPVPADTLTHLLQSGGQFSI